MKPHEKFELGSFTLDTTKKYENINSERIKTKNPPLEHNVLEFFCVSLHASYKFDLCKTSNLDILQLFVFEFC